MMMMLKSIGISTQHLIISPKEKLESTTQPVL
jgi:hypothetical protein